MIAGMTPGRPDAETQASPDGETQALPAEGPGGARGGTAADGMTAREPAASEPAVAPAPRWRRSRVVVPALILVVYLVLAAVLFRGWRLTPVTDTLANGGGE